MRLLSEIRNYMGNYHLKSGVYHFYRSEFGQAIEFLRKALADESTLTEGDRASVRDYLTRSLKALGAKLAQDGEFEAGVEQLRCAVEIDDGYPDIHVMLADLLQQTGRSDEAVDSYRRAVACHPGYLDAHIALGNCLIESGRTDEAVEVLRQAMEVKLEAIRQPFSQGLELLEAGRPAEARDCLHEAFRAVPQLTNAHLEEALERMRADHHEQALDSLDRALRYSPKYPDLHNFRGIVLCELERFDEAFDAFRRSSELCPDHCVPRLNLAFAFLRADQLREGELELEAVLEHDPTEPAARAKLEELRAARVPDKPGVGARS